MKNIVIVYFSETETTHHIAEHIAMGCGSITNVDVASHRISGSEIEHGRFTDSHCLELVDSADAVIFGSPTYMGGPAAQFKAFADATSDRWDTQAWLGKLAAGFTVGANASGDQLATLQYFTILTAQHGMLWVGLDVTATFDSDGRNPLGAQLGLAVHSLSPTLSALDKTTAEYFGARVAETVNRL